MLGSSFLQKMRLCGFDGLNRILVWMGKVSGRTTCDLNVSRSPSHSSKVLNFDLDETVVVKHLTSWGLCKVINARPPWYTVKPTSIDGITYYICKAQDLQKIIK